MAAMPAGMHRTPEMTPIMMDPPEHTKHRLPLQKAFSPRTIAALEGEIVALANRLIDAVIDQGGCDFISAVAEQLPVRVFLKMMGLPAERLPEFRALVHEIFKPMDDDPMQAGSRMRKIADAMMGEILARRTDPKDDLISQLWALEIDGEPMTLELMEDYACLLFVAGLDTVINAIAFGMRHLAVNPETQSHLRANPDLIPEAAEELLRRYSFNAPVRRVTRDTELGGSTLKAGDWVMLYLAAADLDGREFPSPEAFDVRRENKRHVAFGAGPHRCLGSHLARLELQALYRIVLERLPPFRLDSDKPLAFRGGHMFTIASLPLRWD